MSKKDTATACVGSSEFHPGNCWLTIMMGRQVLCKIRGPDPAELQQRAASIIRAVNSHDDLLAALQGLFEHCAMVHKHCGDNSNAREATAAIKAGEAAIAKAGA